MKKYTPLEYVKIDIGNHFGLDKEQFETRIEWVDQNENILETLTDKAKDTFRFTAGVMALRDVQTGKSTGYLVGLDACASGPSIMSCVTGDPIGARNTGLISDKRMDLYEEFTKAMNRLLPNQLPYDKATIKGALMPHFYGSKACPKAAFGDGTPELAAFYEAQEEVAPGAAFLMPVMLDHWRADALEHSWILPDGFQVIVKVTHMEDVKIEVDELDGHPSFMYRYKKNEEMEDGLSLPANIVQSIDGLIVREMCRRCNYKKVALGKAKALLLRRLSQRANNGVHLCDMQKLSSRHNFVTLSEMEEVTWKQVQYFDFDYVEKLLTLVNRSLSRPSFPLITIHDEFKCHPNYMNTVRQTYIDIMAEIAESTMIEAILSEIAGAPVTIIKFSHNLGDLIRQGNYALS